MSTGSWDESSNLVKDLPSPPPSGDDVFKSSQAAGPSTASEAFPDTQPSSSSSPSSSKHTSPHKHGLFSKKSRAAKGLGFLIKASKEGAKLRAKSPSKSPAKSPSKSPSRENLADEDSDLQELDEQGKPKSEQWSAFLQMQDRIKVNVLKTQQNIGKLAAGRVSPSGRISPARHDQLKDDDDEENLTHGQWTNLGADDAATIDEAEGNAFDLRTESEDGQFFNNGDDQDDSELSTLISGIKDLPHFHVTPAGSSDHHSGSSRLVSMDQENQLELLAFEKPVPPSTPVDPSVEEVDLLGLAVEPSSGQADPQQSAFIVNQDLLGLDDFLAHPVVVRETGGGVDGASTDWFMGSSTALSSNQSSLCSSPVAFDPDFLAEQGRLASDSTAVSSLARSLVDDFLQWGAEAERKNVSSEPLSRNPFSSDSFQTVTMVKPDAFNPFATIVESDEADTDVSHTVKPQVDNTKGLDPFMTSLSGVGSTSQDNASNLDPFGCAMPVTSDSTSLDLNANPHVHQPLSEPALSSDRTNSAHKFKSHNPFKTENAAETASHTKSEFDDDFFSKTSAGPKMDTDSIWGTAGPGASSQDVNPFENDLFTASAIPTVSTDGDGTDGGGGLLKSVNPFLTASFENITSASAPSANFHKLFVASAEELDALGKDSSAPAEASQTSDPFDPFSSTQKAVSVGGDDLLGTGEPADSKLGNDHHDDDEGTGFKLKIQAEPIKREGGASGPVPVLPPPPKRPKSPPMSSRENPFDKESPPEENFASFQVMEEKPKEVVEPRGPLKSMSSESSSYEEEENLEPLEPFRPTFTKGYWKLMLRQPVKKKLAGNRYWKTVYVKLVPLKDGPVLKVYESEDCEGDVLQELPLQPCYSVSELTVQQFDQYGKIHTVKVQYIFYRERVGIKPERITPSFVKKPKPTMVLDHAPQVSELLKFGSLDVEEIRSFVWEMEDAFMKLDARREKTLTYNKDELQAEVWDEYEAVIDRDGHTLNQKARVRMFVLAFLTGMPACELGINDRTRKGKEVVGRHDIIPVKTEDWIRIEDPEFHSVVDLDTYEKTNNIRFHPLDACQFELLRFRVRPRENRELPLQLRVQQIMKDRHFEIRCDMLVTGYHAFSKKCGQFPCEDIEIHFKIPETWIYLFRYERKFKYGSFKAMTRKPGKIKGLERITMMAQGLLNPALMEASAGTAKYEHLHRSVVWRVPRLPERNQGAYKNHLFVLRLDLGQYDDIPDTFEEWVNVEFNMPATTVSKAQVRSISVDNPNPPEKWVRYVAKYHYRVQIDNKVETSSDLEVEED
ncbi:uncharacterized protein LOC143281440 [Babylonia areolata]|uniref:uncharacterized protein LOC143281440 n=1 Tax=Babylonia areolata TaxID=304850 RepID=UPI003FD26717